MQGASSSTNHGEPHHHRRRNPLLSLWHFFSGHVQSITHNDTSGGYDISSHISANAGPSATTSTLEARSNPPSIASPDTITSPPSQWACRHSRRRKLDDQENNSQDEDGTEKTPVAKRKKVTGLESQPFACQFFQRDPTAWSHSASCAKSYDSMTKLKEHLKRQHLRLQCHKCGTKFQSRQELEDHDEGGLGASVCISAFKPPSLIQGMSEWQYSKISRRMGPRGATTMEQKWQTIYGILFPHEPVPSPYWSYGGIKLTDTNGPQSHSMSGGFSPIPGGLSATPRAPSSDDHYATWQSTAMPSNDAPTDFAVSSPDFMPFAAKASINQPWGVGLPIQNRTDHRGRDLPVFESVDTSEQTAVGASQQPWFETAEFDQLTQFNMPDALPFSEEPAQDLLDASTNRTSPLPELDSVLFMQPFT